MRGRKPKPAALQKLHGDPRNIGKRKVEKLLGPPVPIKSQRLDAPDDLTEAQREIWRTAVRHAPPGVLQAIDASALRVWVVACDIHQRATAQQAEVGILIRKMNRLGHPEAAPSPLLQIIKHFSMIMLKAASELGFTPVSRPRIFGAHTPNAPLIPLTLNAKPEIPLATFLASKPVQLN